MRAYRALRVNQVNPTQKSTFVVIPYKKTKNLRKSTNLWFLEELAYRKTTN
jgi:hypothetical protein